MQHNPKRIMQQVSSLNGNTQILQLFLHLFYMFLLQLSLCFVNQICLLHKPQLVFDFHSIFSETQPSSELQVDFKCSSTYQLKEFYFSYRFNIHIHFFIDLIFISSICRATLGNFKTYFDYYLNSFQPVGLK